MTSGQLERQLTEYVETHDTLPTGMLLGNLVFFTVREADYDRQKIAGWLLELGLDARHLPHPGTALNAFRKATKSVDRYSYDLGGGQSGLILVRSLTPDPDGQTRLLVREVRAGKRQLRHDTVAELRFYRGSIRDGRIDVGSERLRATMKSSALLPGEHPHVQEALRRIDDAYKRSLQFLGGNKVRGMFRDYLAQFEAVMLHPSTYFVHVSHTEELQALHELAVRMGCQLHRLPQAALPEARAMLVQAVQAEAVTELERIVRDSAALRLKRDKVSAIAYQTIKDRFDSTLQLAARYSDWLDSTLDEVGTAAEVALDEVEQLRKDMES